MGTSERTTDSLESPRPTKRRRQSWIPVVTALIRRDGKVLLGQRPSGHSMPGIWEFPGGKVELGESPEEALRRELHEELGIEAEIGELKFVATHNYGGTGIVLMFFDVHYWKGQLKPEHHKELKWVRPADLSKMELPEANAKVLERIRQVL